MNRTAAETPDALAQFQASLKTLRLERGWTYAQMGEALGFPPESARQNAHELETSAKVPSIEREARVAAAFGMTRAEFLLRNAGA